MVDVHSPAQRSFNMSRIKSRDTKPELTLRRGLHARGFRYRLHSAALPGKPDLVFASRRVTIFVNGCFWHSHACKSGQVSSETNAEFWSQKRTATVARDQVVRVELEALGWRVLTVWECELRIQDETIAQVAKLLGT
jgi:DNA mismatch endonuclease (patch repair protein)